MVPEQQVNILLVDDEPANLLVLKAILDPLEQNLICASSGAEALRCVLQYDFAVILLDVHLPDMDGFETALRIRERARSLHTPIIFLTAMFENTEYVSRGYSVGAVDYIMKPFDPVILCSKVSVFVDLWRMSEQTRLQAQTIRELNREMEVRVIELNAANQELALLTRELTRARDQALAASRSKSTFLANMSHEIRTPMNGVIGMIDSLLRTPLNVTQREYARIIQDSAEVLLDIISDILDFSKIEAGKLDLEIVDFEIAQVMEETVELVANRAKNKNLSLTTYIAPEIPRVLKGDPSRVRQVLLNLASNAVKFTEKGAVSLRAALVGSDDEQVTVRFSVADTGIGIAPSSAQQLFKPFAQADGTVTRKYGGTGLGLAISKHIVEMMEGQIGLESRERLGSTFWFEVPLSKSSIEVMCSPRKQLVTEDLSVASELPVVSDAVKPILVAEDNPVNQKVALHQLRDLGFVAHIVGSGREAVAATLRNTYELIFMDCQMPEMDGFQAASEIRKTEAVSGRHIPIIALTAHAIEGDRDRCLAAGMDDYISKPVTQRKLREVLAKWVGKNGSGAEEAGSQAAENAGRAPVAFESIEAGWNTPIDLSRLREALGSDEIFDVLNLFLSSTGLLLKKMDSALIARDTVTLKAISHELKGSAGTIGADEIAQLSRQMETLIASEDWTGSEAVLKELESAFDGLRDYITHMQGNSDSPGNQTQWGASICQPSRKQKSC